MKNESGFTPAGELVLILPPEVQKKSAAGIIYADETIRKESEATQVGWIVDAGVEAWEHPRMRGLEIGSKVLFTRYQQNTLPVNGIRYFIIRVESVLGAITKNPDYALNAAISSMEAFGANEPQVAA